MECPFQPDGSGDYRLFGHRLSGFDFADLSGDWRISWMPWKVHFTPKSNTPPYPWPELWGSRGRRRGTRGCACGNFLTSKLRDAPKRRASLACNARVSARNPKLGMPSRASDL